MSVRNVVQSTFDEFGKASGGAKKSGSWYVRSAETIVVLNLQKSQYAASYYVNVAVWLLAAGPADAPKPSECHVQTRLERLVPPPAFEERLTALLDLNSAIEEETRHEELHALMCEHLLPAIQAAATLEGLRSAGEGQRLVTASLVDGDGQRLLSAGR